MHMFPRAIKVESLNNYRINVSYEDGVSGIVDLSNLAKKGVFKDWDSKNLFEKVYIDSETNALAWNENLDICPDSVYLKILGLSFEDYRLKKNATD